MGGVAARCSRVRRAVRTQRGFTLLELVVTVTVGALVILALARGYVATHRAGRSARTTTQATGLARGALDSARALGWAGLAHVPGGTAGDPNVAGGAFDPDGVGPLAAEDIAESGVGALAPYVETSVIDGVTYTISTYVTDAGSALKRVTAIVEWIEADRAGDLDHVRRARLSTLVPASVEDVGAAACVTEGKVLGAPAADAGCVDADASGEAASDAPGSFGAAPVISGAGGASSATVSAGPAAVATATIGWLAIELPGVTISASSVSVEARSSIGSMTVSGSGSVTVNGVTYANPAPGTHVSAGGYRIVLNSQRREADGSMSVTFVRVTGPDTEVRAAWAWAKPAELLDA